ncbi:uncharacterized protein A1O9_05180 [Exophiala aquamarina CBS 119918]|uniref:Xylanolytic transcriptional activator regulatory domain-containing protein n=1 Tax=Exophiala aquamarina CBS 119918 TaxID=1182545 RepID=A0A072PDD0_9EURO|nr:uncharacterized protein A1O9_05180 [Exophiala aquamarina CBS 119918]KEF57263.1 hypothetical protein A1O9_05180 [Exophiala aquamarina CBS 119918]
MHRSADSQTHTCPFPATSNFTSEEVTIDGDTSPAVGGDHSLGCRSPASNTKDHEHAFEGDSSVRAHAAFAGSFAKQTIDRSALGEAGPRVHDALSALHQILTMHRPGKDRNFINDGKPSSQDLRCLGMPPLDAALQLLRELKHQLPPTFELICAVTSIEFFTDQCRQVYFATEQFSTSTFIIVNVALYFIFQGKLIEANKSGDEGTKATLRDYCNICQRNIEATLHIMSFILPARKENVIALVLGASYAVQASDPSLAWMLNSTACQLCISLGYQRNSLLPGEDDVAKNSRATLFWIAYILDRALALRLGRPAVLQDYEITLNRTLQHLGEFEIYRETIQCWLAQAEVQGRIYEELYSPAALKSPVEHREQSARRCANILLAERAKLKNRMQRIGQTSTHANTEVELALLRFDELSNLSTLTLVYRALPPESSGDVPHGSGILASECIKIARKAIHAHLKHVCSLGTNTDVLATYMHW